ncbi:MAG: DUF1638 domain-containing protein [bacterium]|nr:DUF1638 domain-containing protein [bacterium]
MSARPAPNPTPISPPRLLILACGALANEIKHLIRLNDWDHVTMECLPARYHNTPDRIVPELNARLEEEASLYDRIFIGYADCGTGGQLDSLLKEWENVERLPGAHCYEFYATSPVFHQLHEREIGTFYLTDFLARHFDRLVWQSLGLDRYPQLRELYFGNYRKLVYLAQFDDPTTARMAEEAAQRLGLEYQYLPVGLGHLETGLVTFVQPAGV